MGLEILPDQRVEAFLTAFRRRLLEAWADGGFPDSAEDMVQALAAHCLLHEYSLAESPAEEETHAGLRVAAVSGDAPELLMLLACYEPVAELWTGRPELPEGCAAFRDRHIDFPRRVRAAAESMDRLTDLSPGVSEAVGRQYEEDPYPRWTRPPAQGSVTLRARLKTLFPSRAEAFVAALETPDVLIAGCGTGQEACALAAGYPDAAITAVDLSRASLGYARCKAEEFGLRNIRFGQADILKLAELGTDFDFIESVGVLHHMEHPEEGLGVLASLLRPGGVMHLGFYSRQGRVAVNAARALIAEWRLEATPEGIRDARLRLLALRQSRRVLGGLFVSPDFYSRPACRDLIFHEQEHQYDVPGLRALAEGAGLDLLGFELQADRRASYRTQFPEDVEVWDWDKVDAFERGMPWAFSEMYRFWLIKP
jgi:SAM-dependent methyltransferase